MRRLTKKELLGNHIKATCRTAKSFALHSHDYFEIEIILEGGGTQYINSEEYSLEKGSVYLLTPADFHEILLDRHTRLWNIAFDETVLDDELKQKLFSAKRLCRNVDEDTLFRLERASELIVAECAAGGAVEPLLEYMLSILLPSWNKKEQLTPIRRAVLYIETHFREDPSLEDAAREACLSPVYFGNLFKKVTGETYVNYLNRCKISCAMMLLENGMSVSRACFDSGFGSLSGFLYTFRKKTGMSPEEYKKIHFVSAR